MWLVLLVFCEMEKAWKFLFQKSQVLSQDSTINRRMFSSIQPLSHIWHFMTPWTVARQASLSITSSQSLLKHMSIELVMPSNYLILCHLLLLLPFPASGSFPMSQFFELGGQSIRVSASASVLPVNIQDWFPLGLTGWISLQSKGLSRVFNTTVQKH